WNKSCAADRWEPSRLQVSQRRSWWRSISPSTSSYTCREGRASEPFHACRAVADRVRHGRACAVAAERGWAIVVGIITVCLVAMMVLTGLHWAAMPPSRVETINVKTVHIEGEFVESHLGTALGADGKVTVRLIAQQYSFQPPCIVVPAETPVTFRGTSTDAIHGFVVGT